MDLVASSQELTTEDVGSRFKRDELKTKCVKPEKIPPLKVNLTRVYSSKQKYLKYFSSDAKSKYVNKRIEEIKKLPNYEYIHNILNIKKTKFEKNPCPWPDRSDLRQPFWNSYSYLIKQIENCILINDWKGLTQCLLLLKDAPSVYHQFLFKSCLINCAVNPAATENNFLEKFLTECLSCQNEEEMIQLMKSQFTVSES